MATMVEAEELIRSSNPSDYNKGLEMLDQIGKEGEVATSEEVPQETPSGEVPNETPAEENPQEVETPEVPSEEQQSQEEAVRSLKINYRGSEFEQEDPDGFLGRKDLEGLKQSAAHKEAHIRFLEQQAMDYEKRLAEMARVKENLVANPVVAKPQETPSEEVEAPVVTKRPKAPKRPDVGFDASYWSEEEEQAMKVYTEAQAQFNEDLDSYFDYLENRTTADPRLNEFDNVVKDYKEKQEAAQAQLEEEAYWNKIEGFRKNHTEFNSYRGTMKDLHQEVDRWMSRLANAAGYNLPISPTVEDVARFNATKQEVAKRYEAGEQQLLNTGVMPPDGYKEYYALADLEAERNQLVEQGVLGSKADLHQVWLQKQDSTGSLDAGISQIETDARKRGAQSVLSTMEAQQANNAVTLPNSANQNTPTGGVADMERAERLKILDTPQHILLQNPELMNKFNEIVELGKY